MKKVISQLDAAGCFVGAVAADESPLEPGVFLIPGGAIDLSPPHPREGKAYKPNADRTGWIELADYRAAALYLTSDGSAYRLGSSRDDGSAYLGIGVLPSWLTTDQRPNSWSVWNSVKWVRDDTAWRAKVTAENQARKTQLFADASARIATLQDAVELEIATPAETSLLGQLRVYRVELSRVDVTLDSPTWPTAPTGS